MDRPEQPRAQSWRRFNQAPAESIFWWNGMASLRWKNGHAQRQSSIIMKKLYAYESFEISVELEPVEKPCRGTALSAPQGFVAIVQIRVTGATRPLVAPIRLTASNRESFATEAEALMAGYSAGQRIVDDTFSLFTPPGE
jgi:hypothetical protein